MGGAREMGGKNRRLNMRRRAVCLISGGMDSAVAAAAAKNKGYEIYALTFDYGQRHRKEIECAKKIVEWLNVKEHKILKINLRAFGGSALTSGIDVPEAGGGGIPATYVPARNTILLSYALAYAEVKDADVVFIGANAVDYSGYPDCRPEYFKAFQRLADLATKKTVSGGGGIKINTPIINLSKKEIVKLGLKLKVPFNKTWSCYRGGERACGVCDSCVLRLGGFRKAKVEDPIKYHRR